MSRTADAQVVVNDAHNDPGGARVAAAVRAVLQAEGHQARVAVTFLGRRRMRQLNRRYLQHDESTDVLTFPLPQPDGSLAGEVYICRYEAARSARERGIPVREEVLRLAVHGTLHLLGWDHPADSSRTESAMWQRQEQLVASLA